MGIMKQEGITASALWLDPDLDGALILPDQDERPFGQNQREVNA